jgi:hypothetical protein
MQNPPKNTKTDAIACLHELAENTHRRSLIVLFSDLFDDISDENSIEALFLAIQHLKYKKHEIVLFHTMDKRLEMDFEFENRPYEFVDMESGEKIKLHANQIKEQFVKSSAAFQKSIEEKCIQYKVDYIKVDISEGYETILYTYLRKRNKMM